MFNKTMSYINDTNTTAKPVVLFKTPSENTRAQRFIAASLLVISLGTLTLQANWVYNASAEDAPATSPVTSEESPSPSASASASPSPSAPVTSPEEVRPTIKILSPNGGETFNNGDPIRISFEQSGARACIFTYTYNGTESSKFAPLTDLSNNYRDWFVEIDNMAPGSSVQAKVKASCYDASIQHGAQDESDAFFTVNNPAPVTAPEVSPSPSSNPSNGGSNPGNGGNNNSSNGGGSVGAPSCNTETPKNAPVILSALSTGKNEITLNWSKAEGNVTEYVVAYGLVKGKPMYGAQFGNVTSTTIRGLSGGVTYFFKVRAGNGCMPGAYSQEIAVKVGGKFINSPAQGFKPGVLGTVKNIKPAGSATPAPSASSFVSIKVEQPQSVNPNSGLFGKIYNFFNGFFN